MKKNLMKSVMFGVIGTIIFLVAQHVLTLRIDYVEPVIEAAEELDPDSIEVLFLGTSHMGCGISPMKIYEDGEIVSYNLATAAQTIDESYYLLQDMLTEQSPSLVVLDMASLFYTKAENLNYRRYLLDSVPMGELKYNLAKAYASYEDSHGIGAALVPMIEYHSRWDELTPADFGQKSVSLLYRMGCTANALVAGTATRQEDIDAEAEAIRNKTIGYAIISEGGENIEATLESELYAPKISEENLDWLLKIKALCEERNIELLLVKIPTRISATNYTGAWTKYKSDQVNEMAQTYGMSFLDLTYASDLPLDFMTDTSDVGAHLNMRGAEKVSEYLLTYLEENYELEKAKNAVYDEALVTYKETNQGAYLRMETDFNSYLERVSELEDVKIIVVAAKEWVAGMDDSNYEAMKKLNLQLSEKGQWGDAYIAIINNGVVEYEAISDRKLEYVYEDKIQIRSIGYYSTETLLPTIYDEEKKAEYITGYIGLNFVVMDSETDAIIDKVNFNTSTEALSHYRK